MALGDQKNRRLGGALTKIRLSGYVLGYVV